MLSMLIHHLLPALKPNTMFSQEEIAALQAYTLIIKRIAAAFYDARYQPRQAVKESIKHNFGNFKKPEDAIGQARIEYKTHFLVEALYAHNMHKAMQFHQGQTAQTFVLEDDQGDWSVLRVPKNFLYSHFKRPKDATMLQPVKKLSAPVAVGKEGWFFAEILPLVPTVSLERYGSGSQPIKNLMQENMFLDVLPIVQNPFRLSQFDDQGLSDMGVLPNGQVVVIDPGYETRDRKVSNDALRRQQFAEYKKAMVLYPGLHDIFEYVLPDGSWAQQRFFPPQQQCT